VRCHPLRRGAATAARQEFTPPGRCCAVAVVIITTVKSGDVIRKLAADGWILERVKGSHHQFSHPDRPGLVTVPHPRKDIPLPTLRSIYRQAGWPWR
jgi:predicted RNA binding protein YcfA (HicA-like mRNA interferase family)